MNLTQKIVVIISFGLLPFWLQAQSIAVNTTNQIIADIYEQVSEEAETEIDFTNFYDDLMFLSDNLINLNKTNKEELEKLQFLQILKLKTFFTTSTETLRSTPFMNSQLIEGLDMTDIMRILPFVKLGEADIKQQKINLNEVFKYGKNDLYLRLDRGLENQRRISFFT